MTLKKRTPPIISREIPPERLLSEKDFRQQVLDMARYTGWRAYWTWTSIHSPAGFPDLVLVRPPGIASSGRVLFIELKGSKGKLTLAQADWLTDLGACPGVEVYLWRPQDWDTLVAILSAQRSLKGGSCFLRPKGEILVDRAEAPKTIIELRRVESEEI